MKEYPTYFYKYRSSKNVFHLDALFKSYSWISSRKEFIALDPNDSKIDFNDITVRQLKIKRNENRNNKFLYRKFDKLYNKGCFTDEGRELLSTLEIKKNFDNLIDSYKLYCVAGNGDNEILWNQCADNDPTKPNDFCVELKAEEMKKAANNEKAQEMIYQTELAKLDLVDFLPDFFLYEKKLKENKPTFISVDNEIEKSHLVLVAKITKALSVKLCKYREENEYRFTFSGKFSINQTGEKKTYPREFIEAIIFGYNANQETKKIIVENMPYPVKYKQASQVNGVIQINDLHKPYDFLAI
ncbi:MAG: hypothetical protein WCK32_04730 [Chlorobiaceae bacterium]